MSTTQNTTPETTPETDETQSTEGSGESIRVGAWGDVIRTEGEAKEDVVVAQIPGGNPDNFVEVVLAHPLNKNDRAYLGLPENAQTEVGQKVKVNKNGAKVLIESGLAAVDPSDREAVAAVLNPEKVETKAEAQPAGEPVAETRQAEAPASPAANPPQGASTPGGNGVEAPKERNAEDKVEDDKRKGGSARP